MFMAGDYIQERFPNGLQIQLKEIHTAPIISHWIWYRIGSRHEQLGATGFRIGLSICNSKEHPAFRQGHWINRSRAPAAYGTHLPTWTGPPISRPCLPDRSIWRCRSNLTACSTACSILLRSNQNARSFFPSWRATKPTYLPPGGSCSAGCLRQPPIPK